MAGKNKILKENGKNCVRKHFNENTSSSQKEVSGRKVRVNDVPKFIQTSFLRQPRTMHLAFKPCSGSIAMPRENLIYQTQFYLSVCTYIRAL